MPDRNEQGKFTSDHDADDLLDAMEPAEPYGTRELADKLGIPRRTAYHYLSQLADDEKVRKKKTDARRAIWIRHEE